MERSWLETVQLLGLDVVIAVVLAMVVADAAWRLLTAAVRAVQRRRRRRRRPDPMAAVQDPWPAQEWRPSH